MPETEPAIEVHFKEENIFNFLRDNGDSFEAVGVKPDVDAVLYCNPPFGLKRPHSPWDNKRWGKTEFDSVLTAFFITVGDKTEVVRERSRYAIFHTLDNDMWDELRASINELNLLHQTLIWDKGVESTSAPVGERFLYGHELVVMVFERKEGRESSKKRMGVCQSLVGTRRASYNTMLRCAAVSKRFKYMGEVVNSYQKPLALVMQLLMLAAGHLMEASGDNTLHVIDVTCGSGTTAVRSHSAAFCWMVICMNTYSDPPALYPLPSLNSWRLPGQRLSSGRVHMTPHPHADSSSTSHCLTK